VHVWAAGHCQRPEDINNEKQASFGEQAQWQTGSLFAEADEWDLEADELEWKLLPTSGWFHLLHVILYDIAAHSVHLTLQIPHICCPRSSLLSSVRRATKQSAGKEIYLQVVPLWHDMPED